MNMKKLIVICSALVVGSTFVIQAQQPERVNAIQAQGGRGFALSETRVAEPRPVESQLVKGMPYSAEIVNESTQVLGDGNRIVQRSSGRVYRDGEGRVRREEDRASGTPSVTITDPVAKTSTTLDTTRKTAFETAVGGFISLQVGQLNEVRSALVAREPSAAGAVTARAGGAGGRGGAGAGAATGGDTSPVPTARGGVITAQGGGRGGGVATMQPRREDRVEETLPSRMIEGVQCTGVRRTTTIAKGAIGNEQPIKIVSEEWTSPDLKVLVMTDVNDPRSGHATYQLQRIIRAEPDPSLFKVPADYTVQRGGGRGRGVAK